MKHRLQIRIVDSARSLLFKVWLLAGCAFLTMAPLKGADIADSPDGKVKLEQQGPLYGDQGWELRVVTPKKLAVWRSVRPVKCFWSNDSRWLVVEDHLMRLSTGVLVFALRDGSLQLVYQTPYSPSDFSMQFYLDSMKSSPQELVLKLKVISIDNAKSESSHVVRIGSDAKQAEATLYGKSQEYGVPGAE